MWKDLIYSTLIRFFITFFLVHYCLFSYAQQGATVRGTQVNVRDCAALNCDVLFQLNTGDKCKVLFNMKDENILGYGINSWYKIEANGKEGFIYGAFLDFISNDLKTAASNKSQDLASITANQVNARTCGGLACNKAFQLNVGDKIKIIGKTNDYFVPGIGKKPWYEVEHNGQKGFVYSHFVDCQNCDFQVGGNGNVVTKKKEGVIIGDKVNVRACSDTNCDVVFQMNLGDKCTIENTIQSKSNASLYPWYEIEHNGQKGFVYGQYFSEESVKNNSVKIWALIVGVADYSTLANTYGVTDLNYSASDAKKIYQFLKSPEGGNIPDNQIALLRDTEATRADILAKGKQLFQQANNDDLIIVYFSGHGGPNFFMAHDQPLKYQDIKTVIESSAAKKRICIADACYSGTWSDNANAQVAQKSMTSAQLERLYYDALSNSSNGIALFMSSAKDETSIEIPQIQQGLFTYLYIEGLKGHADADGNKIITIQELYEFVKYGVSTIASQLNHQQTPNISGFFDNSMPIGVVR